MPLESDVHILCLTCGSFWATKTLGVRVIESVRFGVNMENNKQDHQLSPFTLTQRFDCARKNVAAVTLSTDVHSEHPASLKRLTLLSFKGL